jgi:hypothetical protein
MRLYIPSFADHGACHCTHAKGSFETGLRRAGDQLPPPSRLTSTAATGPLPDHAIPWSICSPGATKRQRDCRSGMPGGSITDRTRFSRTGSPGSSADRVYRYTCSCCTPLNGSLRTVIARSHFTDAMPYQLGTTRRSGKPCSGERGSPFAAQANITSGCIASATGRLRSNACSTPKSTPLSQPVKSTSTASSSRPACWSSGARGVPVH